MIGLLLYFNLNRILNKAILFVMEYSYIVIGYKYFCLSEWPEYNFDHSWFNIVDLQTLESSSCWITNLHNQHLNWKMLLYCSYFITLPCNHLADDLKCVQAMWSAQMLRYKWWVLHPGFTSLIWLWVQCFRCFPPSDPRTRVAGQDTSSTYSMWSSLAGSQPLQ